jgi:predicted TIM-barrel fold metal-dependent hydrolase
MAAHRIDVHHHYATAELVDELTRVGIHDVGGQPLMASNPEDSLAVMDRHDIAAALLSVPIPLTFRDPAVARRVARSMNELGAGYVADHRDRFGLLAALPLPDVDAALAELGYALDTLGADGILLLSNYSGVYLGDPRLEAVFAELDRRAGVALVHPAVAGSPVPMLEASLFEFIFDTTRAVANLVVSRTLERHPDVRVILAHAGGTVPYVRDRIIDRGPILKRVKEAAERHAPRPTPEELQGMLSDGLARSRGQLERLFYDTTLSANDTVLGVLHELVPTTQILLGTDYPMAQEIGVTVTLAGLDRHSGFDDADRRAIEGGNASRLFPRVAEPVGSRS